MTTDEDRDYDRGDAAEEMKSVVLTDASGKIVHSGEYVQLEAPDEPETQEATGKDYFDTSMTEEIKE